MCLGIGARKNGRVGFHRDGRLLKGLSKGYSLMRNPIQSGSQAAARPQKSHAVSPRRIKCNQDDVELGRGQGVDRKKN